MPKDPHCLMVLSTVAILYNAPEYQDEFGQTTTYSFNPGYNLVGDGTRICQATGLQIMVWECTYMSVYVLIEA